MKYRKQKIRKLFRNIREQVPHIRRAYAANSLYEAFKATPGLICSYCSFKDELDTTLLNKELLKRDCLVLPKIEGNNLSMRHVRSFEEDLELHSLGFLEPKSHCAIACSPSLVLVPGIAFDENKHRLGYGLGYYDRFLSTADVHSIGVGFMECLSVENLPRSDTDILLSELALF